jgi:uncharacterized membrane protein
MQEKNSNKIESYDFEIVPLLKEGFSRSYGVKWNFMGAIIIYAIIALITGVILEVVFPSKVTQYNDIISSILAIPVTLPIMIGITMLGVKQARDERLEIPSVLNYFSYLLPILLTYMAMSIMLFIGFMLLILPGIYLAISYSFTYALVVDKGLGTWEAMELSRKTVTKQWLKFFGLALLAGLGIMISAIPFGIGLIWSVPTIYISYGLLYHHLFDEEEERVFIEGEIE